MWPITIMHETEDQIKPMKTRIRLTKDGVDLGRRATMNPKIARGIMQYPITLIVWKMELN